MRWFILSPTCRWQNPGPGLEFRSAWVWVKGRAKGIRKLILARESLICRAWCWVHAHVALLFHFHHIPVLGGSRLLVWQSKKPRLAEMTCPRTHGQSAVLLRSGNLWGLFGLLCPLTPRFWDLFSSRGNWIGEAPYKMGRPCSACPPSYQGNCNNNMCFSGSKSNKLLWFWIFPGLWWASKGPSPKTRPRNNSFFLKTWVGLTPLIWFPPSDSIF